MSNLVTRTISGIVYIAIIISAIVFHPIAFGVVFAILTGMTTWEFYSIIDKSNNHNRIFGTIAGTFLFISSYMFMSHFHYIFLILYFLFIICLLISELFREAENPINNWAYLLMGQIMVALPFASLNNILFNGMLGNPNTISFVLALFVIIWTNDTGAYCVGSLIGKHKMFPRVSPGKSWEGLIGGFAFAIIAGWIFSMFVSVYDSKAINIMFWMTFAAIVSIFGTLGDLMESLTKRTLGIKDSGNIIPGHGGMLDRFDSMLLAAPAIAIYITMTV